MPYGMYISAAGAEAQSRYVEVLTNNLANADTAGFKPEFTVMQSRHSEAIEQGEDVQGSRSINDIGGGVASKETVTDFRPGTLKWTGNPSDLAIDDSDGKSFFVVEKDGERMLTRAGNFRFSSTGQLQTQNGFPVLSSGGAFVQIDPRLPWRFTEDGAIEQAGARINLALEKPASLGDLAKAGQNLFRPLANTRPADPNERRVRDGHLEMSSVKPVQVMVDLIKANRAYEANVRLIQHQDSMIGSLVNRVLRQN